MPGDLNTPISSPAELGGSATPGLFRSVIASTKDDFRRFRDEVKDAGEQVAEALAPAFDLPILKQLRAGAEKLKGAMAELNRMGTERYGQGTMRAAVGAFALPMVGLGASAAVLGGAEAWRQGKRVSNWVRSSGPTAGPAGGGTFGGIGAREAPAGGQAGLNFMAFPNAPVSGQPQYTSIQSTGASDWSERQQGWARRFSNVARGGGVSEALHGGLTSAASTGNPYAAAADMILRALPQQMQFAAKNINTFNNQDLSGFQKSQSIADSLPVVGDLVKSFRALSDAVDGTTERMRQEGIRHEDAMADIRLRGQNEMQVAVARQESLAASNAAAVMRGAQAVAYTPSDRSTVRGMVAYQEEQTRLPAIDARAQAERQAEAARRTAAGAQSRLAGFDAERARLGGERVLLREQERNILRRYGGGRTATGERVGTDGRTLSVGGVQQGAWAGSVSSAANAALGENLNQQAELNTRLINLEQQRRQASDQASTAAQTAAQAESRARQANIDVMRAELQILQNRERAMSGSATQLARMTQFERETSLQFVRMARDRGIESLLPEQRAMAEQIAPQFIGRLLERAGEADRTYQTLRDEIGEFGEGGVGQTIAGTRQRQANVQMEIRNEVVIDQERLASDIAAALGPALARLIASLESDVFFQRVQRQIDRAIARNQPGANR